MRYKLKQKFWSFGDDYSILDENDRTVFQVHGKPFSWGSNLSLMDANGQEVAHIKQKLFSLKPRFEIYKGGELFAEVVKEFSWFKQKFLLDVPGPNDYTIDGSFWEHEFAFHRMGREVARVSKKAWAASDTYGIDIVENEDDVSILATCVVIDLVCHDGKDD